jgi:hypothetical protein
MKHHFHFRRHGLGIFFNDKIPVQSEFTHLTPCNIMGAGAPRKKNYGLGMMREAKVKPISFYF